MDAWDVADALAVGRDIPAAKLRQLLSRGDGGDRLYVHLFQIARGYRDRDLREATATCPHHPTAAAWFHVMQYALRPTPASYRKIVKAARAATVDAGTMIRLVPLVLSGRHRRLFAKVVERAAAEKTIPPDDMKTVRAALKMRGPAPIYERRSARFRGVPNDG